MKHLSPSSVLLSSTVAALALTFGACSTQSASTASSATPAPAPVAAAPAPAKAAPVVVAASIDFDKQVKPFFAEYCAGCHGGNPARRPSGGVNVTTKSGLLSRITPGDPDHSGLFEEMGGPRKSMPPRNAPQPEAADIAMIKQWITEGAKVSDSYPTGA